MSKLTRMVKFVIVAGFCLTIAKADVIPLVATYVGPNGTAPVVDVKIKDKDGNVVTLKGLIDSGNTTTTGISAGTAAALGLTVSGTEKGLAAGGATESPTTSLAGREGSVPSADGKSSASIPDKAVILKGVPDGGILLGGDFLKPFGDVDLKRKKGQVVLTTDEQVTGLNPLPLQTPLTLIAGLGTFVDLGNPGSVPTVEGFLDSSSGSLTSPFVVSTGFDSSLISMSTAQALGLDLSTLPLKVVGTYVGDLSVPAATIDFSIFPGQRQTLTFGILSDAQNPLNENVFGGDALKGFDEYDFNVLFGKFEATPVPEPSTVELMMCGLCCLLPALLCRASSSAA